MSEHRHPGEALGNGHLKGSRLPLAPAVAKEYEISAPDWRVLVEQVFPSAKTVEAVMLALAYCRKRNLDIYKRPVHIVPMWSSTLGRMVETVWPGIAEIRTTAMRTKDYAGIDEVVFGPPITQTFAGTAKDGSKIEKTVTFPEWASVTVYRLDRTGTPRAYKAKVFWLETYASMGKGDLPNEMWESRAYGQLDKCVEAAAIRKAFPEEVGNTYSAEEMEGKTIDITPDHTPAAPPPAPKLVSPPSGPAASGSAETKTLKAVGDFPAENGRAPENGGAGAEITNPATDLGAIPPPFDRRKRGRPRKDAAPYDPRNAIAEAEVIEATQGVTPEELSAMLDDMGIKAP